MIAKETSIDVNGLTSDLETIILNILSSSAFTISFAKYRGGFSINKTATKTIVQHKLISRNKIMLPGY